MKRLPGHRTQPNAIHGVNDDSESRLVESRSSAGPIRLNEGDGKHRRIETAHALGQRKGPYPFDVPPTAMRWPVVLPLLAILIASFLIRWFEIDRLVSSMSYDFERAYWPFERAEPWLGFYRYGIYPPVILGLCGFFAAVSGRWIVPITNSRSANAIRREGLFLALMLLIGPGLLVNAGLKSLWGRPRPLQCEDFGGPMGFKPVGEISTQKFPNSSFPSGHAATAFYVIAPAFLFRRNNALLRRRWFLAGTGYGLAMGFTRVLQGGHFVSDVLWAGAIVYFVGVVLARIALRQDEDEALPINGV